MRPQGKRQTASRRVLGAIAAAVRSAVAPSTLFQPAAEPVTAPDPTDVYGVDETPAVETIEAAAAEFERAVDQARRADRGKRAARKVLDRLPAGVYGQFRIFRTPSSRQTPDLAEITRIFKAHGLGPVPMKPCAPSLKVERIADESAVSADLAAIAV